MGYEVVWGVIAHANAPMLGLARRMWFTLAPDPDDRSLVRAEIALGS